ncbi:MAG: hypothetical protein LUD15_15005 [Bacteroides sp.]|nr:hypothetical protein [Bacteroides sp.]
MEEMKYILESEDFTYSVCLDMDDCLNKLNHFSSDIVLLLDEKNHIIATGNPVFDLQVKNNYLEKIAGNKAPEKRNSR